MSATLLGVDDSVTIRKVLEIAFAGEGYRVVTAENAGNAVKKAAADKPNVVVLDVTLPDQNGYEVCKAIKSSNPGVPVLMMSSKQFPFDAAKGTASGADDHIDKPFDTQSLIDKVTKLLSSKPATSVAPAPAPVAPVPAATPSPARPVPSPAPAPVAAAAKPAAAPPPPPAAATAKPATPPAVPSRQPTQVFGGEIAAIPKPVPQPAATPAAPPPAQAQAVPPAPVARPAQPSQPQAAPPTTPTPVASPVTSPVTAAVNGQMGEKLAQLGLTPAQADAVLALSREVVERVVWEVVPTLAEALIKEEIKRLTAEK